MVDWPTIIASVSLSVIGSFLVTEYQLHRERSVEKSADLEEWYNDGASYAAEVRRVWGRMFEESEGAGVNFSEIQAELGLLEGKISRHASVGEQIDADQDVVNSLDDLSKKCRQAANEHLHLNSMAEFSDHQEDCLEAVEEVEEALREGEENTWR